nr:hypothetical protein [Tanacetum cinerariifolium]
MSTQQDIYAVGFENRHPKLNKENYVPWSSCLLRYAKSKPNGKLIHNSIINGPYVGRMIPEPGDPNREIEADDQAIQTILLGLPEDIYAVVDSCETTQEIWLHDLRAERLAKTKDPLALMATSNNPYNFPMFLQDQPSSSTYMQQLLPNNNIIPQPSFNQIYMQQPMPNPKDITDPTTSMNMALALMTKAFKLNYLIPTNNNQRISSIPRNRHIAQPGMNMGQDRQMQMVGCNGGNQFGKYTRAECRELEWNPNGNGNLVAIRAEGNVTGNNGNQIRCYNCRGLGHFSRNYTVRPKRRDAAYLQSQLLIAQKEEAGIQLQAKEFDLMAAAADLDEIEEVNANYGSAEVHNNEFFYDNEIFNMFTQEEQYTELLEPIPEPHQVPQNAKNVISEVSSVEQNSRIAEQHPVNVEETRVLYDSLYNNLAIEVEKVNTFLKEAAKFVRDFKSLAKEDDESLAKHKALELEIQRLLRAVVSQDIMPVVQHNSIGDTSNLQTELEDVKSTTRNRRPLPRNNPKNDKSPSKSKSCLLSNNLKKIEENHRNLQSSSNQRHMSFERNNIKLSIWNAKSEVVCDMCKQCLITINHDVCVINYVNGMNSHGKKQKANVSNMSNQKKHKAQ